MTNTKLLNDAIVNKGLKKEWIAKQLGITRVALFEKINNRSEFKASEVAKLSKILSLPDYDRELIFLSLL